jgi:Tol biopolymer transport system component
MRFDGSGRRQITDNTAVEAHPTWSPDGKWIAYQSAAMAGQSTELYRIPAGGGVRKRITDSTVYELYPDWGVAP